MSLSRLISVLLLAALPAFGADFYYSFANAQCNEGSGGVARVTVNEANGTISSIEVLSGGATNFESPKKVVVTKCHRAVLTSDTHNKVRIFDTRDVGAAFRDITLSQPVSDICPIHERVFLAGEDGFFYG